MKKTKKQIILESIFLLVDLNHSNFRRHMKILKTFNPKNLESWVSSYRIGNIEADNKINEIIKISIDLLKGPKKEIEEVKNAIVNLNSLLSTNNQIKPIIDLEQEMKKIEVKNILTPKQFSEKYNISISRQRDFRNRLNNALPYHQMVHRGAISYYVNEVDKWLESNNIH